MSLSIIYASKRKLISPIFDNARERLILWHEIFGKFPDLKDCADGQDQGFPFPDFAGGGTAGDNIRCSAAGDGAFPSRQEGRSNLHGLQGGER